MSGRLISICYHQSIFWSLNPSPRGPEHLKYGNDHPPFVPEVLQQGYEIYKFDTQLYDLSKYAYEI